jgi:uncharacterized protein YndB with AHSA1/START domain
MTRTLEYTLSVGAPPAEVFRAFTRATPLRDWLCDIALADARIGGRLYLWWNRGYYSAGEYTALEPDRRVAFTWMGRTDPARTEVDVQMDAHDGPTNVRLTHSGLGDGDDWDRAADEFGRGWTTALENLQSLLETGQDLRYTRRPMLGITLDEFNPEIAAQFGIPVTEGVRITTTLPGMAAAEAGLRGNDLLVSMDGRPVPDYPALVMALQGKRAGDTVPIAYYRGSDYRTGPMTLSARFLPEVPPTPGELAAAIHGYNATLLRELDGILEGVPDELARARPDGHDWTALEVMAHLVVSERESQAWIADLINDDERFSDRYTNSSSVTARVDAIVAVRPTVRQMRDAVAESLGETEAMVAALPAEAVDHKGNYWKMGHNLLQNDQHWEEHLDQIKEALAQAAKRSAAIP